ncbi:MAG TPA: DNA-processing protein DprA [Acetivibrio sp.]|nr:DNA-protecting protein DprA [Clostridium sp.]HOQ38453.1 DNA-processing protein DprA [Acetivibrio sp.]HPT90686.1 DNA-processing protein DprA [Acetivibrio sp.]HQA57049.1 DNA-processing protein DprA [Acetivibrio sp.]
MESKIRYWVWLSSVPGVGAVKSRKLLEHFKDIYNVWNAKRDELGVLPFLSRTDVSNLTDEKIKENTDNLLESITKHNIKVVTIEDSMYPLYLKNIYDPPIVIYMKGNIGKDEKYLAVVGSRRASSYGIRMAQAISGELAKYGITVVSGMARGIDSYAHKGALDVGGRTIAVLGCGLDIAYPSENKKLMENIVLNGACISEYLPGTTPAPGNFPARNRIISGISLGVIVIEAGERSGSLITANFALEQGREVFALPGNVSNYNSTGTNKLIKEGAKIVTGIDDILEEINISFSEDKIKDFFSQRFEGDKLLKDLDDDEKKVVECLKLEPLHIDVISRKTGISVAMISSILIMLELKGIVEQLPGKIFKLKF